MDSFVALQQGFFDRSAVDIGAIGGTQVLDYNLAILDHNLAVGTRDGGISQLEIIGKTAPQKISAGLEFDFPSNRGTRIYYESGHKTLY